MFDLMIIGQITLDHNIDYDGREEFRPGAVTFSGHAASAIGHSVAVVPKGDRSRLDPFDVFKNSKVDAVFPFRAQTARKCRTPISRPAPLPAAARTFTNSSGSSTVNSGSGRFFPAAQYGGKT